MTFALFIADIAQAGLIAAIKMANYDLFEAAIVDRGAFWRMIAVFCWPTSTTSATSVSIL